MPPEALPLTLSRFAFTVKQKYPLNTFSIIMSSSHQVSLIAIKLYPESEFIISSQCKKRRNPSGFHETRHNESSWV